MSSIIIKTYALMRSCAAGAAPRTPGPHVHRIAAAARAAAVATACSQHMDFGRVAHMAPACCRPPDGHSSLFCSAVGAVGAVSAIDMHGHYGTFETRNVRSAIPEDFSVRRAGLTYARSASP